MSDFRLKLIALALLGVAVGYFVAKATSGEHELALAGPLNCGGANLELDTLPGAQAHGLVLFVGGYSEGSPVELSLKGFQSQTVRLFKGDPSEPDSFYYSGRWTGPATLSARSATGNCRLRVAYRFRATLGIR